MTTATDNTTHTLLALRRRASVRADAGAVALIDAAIEGDADAMLRARVGDVANNESPKKRSGRQFALKEA